MNSVNELSLTQHCISKAIKYYLSKIKSYKTNLNFTDYTHAPLIITPEYYIYIWFYEDFITCFGYERIENAILKFTSQKFATKVTDIVTECRRFEQVLREERGNNVRDIYGQENCLDVSHYMPLAYSEILRCLKGPIAKNKSKILATLISQYLEWHQQLDYDQFWASLQYDILSLNGTAKGIQLYKSILRDCTAWEENYGIDLRLDYKPLQLPKKDELSSDDYALLTFLRKINAKYDFYLLRRYSEGSFLKIRQGLYNLLDNKDASAILLAYGVSKLADNEYNELFAFSRKIHKIPNGDDLIYAANRICHKYEYALIPKFCKYYKAPYDGKYLVPWENVEFHNGYVEVKNIKIEGCQDPVSYTHSDSESERTIGWLLYFFKMKVTPIELTFENGEIVDGRFPDISSYVNHLGAFTDVRTIKFEDDNTLGFEKHKNVIKIQKVTFDDFRKAIPEGKNIFMDKLCKLMIDNEFVWKYNELNKHTYNATIEPGYAFCISESSDSFIYAFENYLNSRCTLLFKVPKYNSEEELEKIASYLSSSNNNKRLKMQKGASVKVDDKEIHYCRAEHNDEWEIEIRRFINMEKGFNS